MTNTETMQLDLFNGVVLTTKQQEQVDSFIKNQEKRAIQCQEDISKTMLLLDEAGFVMGVGYKIMCTSITEQYRHYKPSSLLTKLKEHRKSIINELDRNNKEQACLDYTVAKYKKLYPKAKVRIGSDYYRGYRRGYESFPVVVVDFKSGSSVSLKLGYNFKFDDEMLHKSYDAQKETIKQKLERFNNQKAK